MEVPGLLFATTTVIANITIATTITTITIALDASGLFSALVSPYFCHW